MEVPEQAGDPVRVEDRMQVDDPEQEGDQVLGEGPEQEGDQVQVVDQSPHCVLYLVHKQNQLRDLEGVELEQVQHLFPPQRLLVGEERVVLVSPHRESLHLRCKSPRLRVEH